MDKISVIIPNYNGIKYLRGCLESLYAQEPGTPKFDILVVDNASGDGSMEQAGVLVEQRASSSIATPGTRFIFLERNTGFCHAVNVGIRETDADYIVLLNNDTLVKPGFIKSLYEAIKKDDRIFSVSARMLMWDRPELLDDAGDRYTVLGWAYAVGKGRPKAACDRPGSIFSSCGGAAIYRRSILEQIGLFDELHFAYLEDLDLGYRARINGYINRYEPGAEVLHFGSASTGSRYNKFKTRLAAANNVYVVYKNMPLLQLLWNLPFLALGFGIKWLFFCRKKMGGIYLKGFLEGVGRCLSPEGRARKVPFSPKNFGNYFKIQLELYLNTILFLTKS